MQETSDMNALKEGIAEAVEMLGEEHFATRMLLKESLVSFFTLLPQETQVG